MRVLYSGLLYNYGNRNEGFSYEHMNIECGLKEFCDVDIYYPDVTRDLIDNYVSAILNDEYDAIFNVAFDNNLDLPESIAKIALKRDIPVLEWQSDASWRYHNFIVGRRHRVSHFITTHSLTTDWFRKDGLNVIESQWAASPLIKKSTGNKEFDILMYGQKHGQLPNGRFVRAEIVDAIINAGLKIDIWGNYWEGYSCWHGYETNFMAMFDNLGSTKIGLNLSNPWHTGTVPQLKGRLWEWAAAGVCQVTTPAHNLEKYFEPDKEIIVANSIEDLISKLRFYLEYNDEREKVALAGYARVQKDHQWKHRFEEIFNAI